MTRHTYISVQEIAERHGVHKSTIWRRLQLDPSYPKPVNLSARCTRWKLAELEAWELSKASPK